MNIFQRSHHWPSSKNSRKGFTLVEILMYMGLFAILLTILTDMFVSTIEVRLDSESTAQVDQDSRFLLTRFAYDVSRATAVTTPAALGGTAASLGLTIGGAQYTYALNNGSLELTSPTGTEKVISSESRLSALNFQKIGNSGGKETVRITFTVTSVTQRRGAGSLVKSYQTTVETMKKNLFNSPSKSSAKSGQALLTLMVFMATAVVVTAAAVIVIVINSATTSKYAYGERALAVAEAGADNAVLRLLRDPSYTGETLSVDNGTALITVTGTTTRTVISEGSANGAKRRIQVDLAYTNTILNVTAWREIP